MFLYCCLVVVLTSVFHPSSFYLSPIFSRVVVWCISNILLFDVKKDLFFCLSRPSKEDANLMCLLTVHTHLLFASWSEGDTEDRRN